MIEVSGLTYSYPGGRQLQYPGFALQPGEAMLLLGPSGCGKTTLLHMLAGLLRPHSGQVSIQGTHLSSQSERALDRFRGQHIGIIFQRSYFVQSITVKDNILLAPYLAGKKSRSQDLDTLCSRLGIRHLLHKLPAQLSVGEQQRAGIARALLHKPALLLADEPTSSLDDHNAATVGQLLLDLAQQNQAALVVVTHDERLKQLFANQLTLA